MKITESLTQKNIPARDPDKLIFNFSSHFLSDSEKSLLCQGFQHYNKMKLSIKNLFSKCDQFRSFLQIWSHLLKKSLMENFVFCAVQFPSPSMKEKADKGCTIVITGRGTKTGLTSLRMLKTNSGIILIL